MKLIIALLTVVNSARTEYNVHFTCTNGLCNCIDENADPLGINYIGDVATTKKHRKCLPWSRTKFETIDGTGHSFCRNPDGKKGGPYCVVGRGRIGFCDVPKCPAFDAFEEEDSLFNQLLDGVVNIGGILHQQTSSFGGSIRDRFNLGDKFNSKFFCFKFGVNSLSRR